ncbi:MAG: Anion transporter [Gammaproteobacteria bacterium HGW-Gammaproteobacteria-14]|nr:MAG: Anion transporter [Gammaproteobacteria bacterium HGW-Gammaproteobacteria-14]
MKPARIALALAVAIIASFGPDDPSARAGVALFALAGTLWLTEAISLTYTALLIPLIGVALGLADVNTALRGFAHPVIGLFLGGFALAAALSVHGIDRWLANRLIRLARGNALGAALLLALATALLSMWISNTAAAAMMLPIALGLSVPLAAKYPRYQLFVLLGLAWGANIGGIATLVGSPPNAITAAALGWGFDDWLKVGMPAFIVLFPLALVILYATLKPERDLPDVRDGGALPFPRHRAAILTVIIFLTTVSLWVFGKPLAQWLGIDRDFDTWVALLAIALLGISGTLEWKQIEKQSNWGVLLLFGGGITLSTLMQSSGASAWMANGISQILPADQPWLLYLLVATFVVYLTELVSNTASAALLVPLFMPVAAVVGADPVVTAAIIGIAASCAFMLPVATPPNALVFGTGCIPQQQMIRAGMRMNLIAAILITGLMMVLVS